MVGSFCTHPVPFFGSCLLSAIIFFFFVVLRVACVWLLFCFPRGSGVGAKTVIKRKERKRPCVERSLLPCEEYAQQRAK
jgi:hypothetical protein